MKTKTAQELACSLSERREILCRAWNRLSNKHISGDIIQREIQKFKLYFRGISRHIRIIDRLEFSAAHFRPKYAKAVQRFKGIRANQTECFK